MLQYCAPYWQKRETFVKGRWCGHTLLSLLVKEFKTFDTAYYQQAIQQGRYQIIRKGTILPPDTTISQGDVLQSWTHKHEPPIPSMPSKFDVVFQDEDLVVVNKPSGVPVHPTGNYYKQTLLEQLQRTEGKLHTVHRLDKDTSGLVILARNAQTASRWQQQISARSVSKQYLARVVGRFPAGDGEGDGEGAVVEESAVYTVETTKGVDHALGVSRPAKTVVVPWKYDPHSDESVVVCTPVTGRTHQIRIHCARLGHPIVDDPLYSKGTTLNQLVCSVHQWEDYTDKVALARWLQLLQEERAERLRKLCENATKCHECGIVLKQNHNVPSTKLKLHSWKYDNGTQSFATALPDWV